ncbi:MAG: ribonucleotide-diphosphate reductase subunit alpha [Alphaproteobacteria bacterium RIFCSPLOWO2_01_FULL_40_26]|nr:MAG: ribonucleotide-diphosphate reductase subunit alpha [Alphaproteobacteria bacterium RIFCSPHIGHO2_02_FULL_40_34]OFW85497.1 MAG: ribonucleotide-diphosphate reductase subunit alpha [Alphaproteobacteria bacterium RIFCSPHIGHO2_01_FULL_40_8]OFW94569.1 MAG: ribonucleotide-diphosphate reductase subunit alpha [Alphaproteobacteria bacterium RIFCSPLOWO2_01_FULL_40_26]OFX10321.1 MAG: ribonucleotide-diphosphate reductase subunit alpha [Alphaproteobacteria bacterium RIFCSPLOWO2_02_FULL_40_19]OFX11169.1
MKLQSKQKFAVDVDAKKDEKLSNFGKAVLKDRYLMPGENYQDLFARVAAYYADDYDHANRLYGYIANLWFMPATPILSNGGTNRGLPISCFLNEVSDSLAGIVGLWNENVWLASKGGGIGSYWGNLRSIGETVRGNGKTSGIIPFIKVMDSQTLAISQGSLRRGSAAVYLPINHPEIEEFIDVRRPTGGDPNRRSLNLHHGVVITDEFMRAVEKDEEFGLRSPFSNEVVENVKARTLWTKLLTARVETGEPYILFIDAVNRTIPDHHKKLGLQVKTSNLCSEITLPTGEDHLKKDRTAVCCLSSLNLEFYDEWKDHPQILEDVMRFLDNVLQDFISKAPDSMAKAKYSAMRERSVGLGVMGFHSFLQGKNVPMESAMAKVWNKKIFQHIKHGVDKASKILAKERGACPDAAEAGVEERFSNKIAIAPTASISIIAGNSSPGIEPFAANSFTQKTLTGSFNVRNKNLVKLLESKGKNTEDVWSSITINEGSVQHLDFLDEHEKLVYKTAQEIDQRWIIDLAAERQEYICQAQSLNVFVPGNVSKKYLHEIHFRAWQKGLKSLYYCRSTSIQRADKVSNKGEKHEMEFSNQNQKGVEREFEECLACQ